MPVTAASGSQTFRVAWPDLYHTGPQPDYNTIQEGIDSAPTNYTVHVHSGEYNENLTIPKEKNGIIIKGQDSDTTVIRGNLIFIDTTATISGFSVAPNVSF